LCFNSTGTQLAVGASDFLVKIVDVQTNCQKVLNGHTGPVLSVALHPRELFIASSSCDGTVRVWLIADLKLVKVISGLPVGNDFLSSKSLTRLIWDKTGKYLFVPKANKVVAYAVDSWNIAFELTETSTKEFMSILCLSPCGHFVAVATEDGQILVWDLRSKTCIARHRDGKKFRICGLAWHPYRNEITFCDDHGYIGLITGIIPSLQEVGSMAATDLFDDDDNSLLMDAAQFYPGGSIPGIDADGTDGSDDFAEDDVSVSDKHASASTGDTAVVSSINESKAVMCDRHWQQPFQSGSTPVSLSARFMVWNNIGVIIQYDTDDEQSINVEFHDTAVHHTMHINNSIGHTLADLSSSAVLLACEGSGGSQSHLVCMHFGSWDNSKEWSISMPAGECIQALCLSQNWLAVATDRRLVRVFSIAGVQMQMFCLPGPVVTLAANADKLLVVYHYAFGLPGDQCLGVRLMTVCGKHIKGYVDHLPLSVNSTLVWIGFSSEGTPFYADSRGIVRMLNVGFGNTWTEVADLQLHCKGKLDCMWVIGVSENPQQLRAVLCKGAKYPPVLPRPTVQILSFKLPMCEIETDKGILEEQMWRSTLFSDNLIQSAPDNLSESDKSKLTMAKQEILMKLFALACKSGREVRATELCHLMPSARTVQLAIKYASRLHLIQLAERLGKVAQLKVEEEEVVENEVIYSQFNGSATNSRDRREMEINVSSHQGTAEISDADCDIHQHRAYAEAKKQTYEVHGNYQEKSELENEPAAHSMLLRLKKDSIEKTSRTISDSQSGQVNPFRVTNTSSEQTPLVVKGTSIFDCMEKPKLGQQNVLKEKTASFAHCEKTKPLTDFGYSQCSKRQKLDSKGEVISGSNSEKETQITTAHN
jgi:chromosome transmission fidelity protein 4